MFGISIPLSRADAPEIIWESATDFSAQFHAVTETPDGGLIIAGTFSSHPCLYKYEMAGDTLWTYQPELPVGFTGALVSVEETSGGYITCGKTVSDDGNMDYFLALVDPDGEEVWNRSIDLGEDEVARAILPGSSGGFYSCGYIDPEGSLRPRALTMAHTPTGDTLWTATWWNINVCKSVDLEEMPDGSIVVVAQAGRPEMLSYTPEGDLTWSRYYTELQVTPPCAMVADSIGICFGTFYYSGLCRTDLLGEPVWWDYYGMVPGGNYFEGLTRTRDGGYAAAGWISEIPGADSADREIVDGWIIRIGPSGKVLWYDLIMEFHPAGPKLMDVIQVSTGGYVAVGYRSGAGWQMCYAPETGIEEGEGLPAMLLGAPSPNPSCGGFSIPYSVPGPMSLDLSVYSLEGHRVADLIQGPSEEGQQVFDWDAGDLPSGCYVIVLRAGQVVESRRCVLCR